MPHRIAIDCDRSTAVFRQGQRHVPASCQLLRQNGGPFGQSQVKALMARLKVRPCLSEGGRALRGRYTLQPVRHRRTEIVQRHTRPVGHRRSVPFDAHHINANSSAPANSCHTHSGHMTHRQMQTRQRRIHPNRLPRKRNQRNGRQRLTKEGRERLTQGPANEVPGKQAVCRDRAWDADDRHGPIRAKFIHCQLHALWPRMNGHKLFGGQHLSCAQAPPDNPSSSKRQE